MQYEYKNNFEKWNDLAYWMSKEIKPCGYKVGTGWKAIKIQLDDGMYWVRFDEIRNKVGFFTVNPNTDEVESMVFFGDFNESRKFCEEKRWKK